jgi:DNA-binding IclR family transcriptional regulator
MGSISEVHGEVKSSIRTLQLLNLLSNYKDGISFTEIQRTLDIPKSSLSVLLSTIEKEKWIEHDKSVNLFKLGIVAWETTQRFMNNQQLVDIGESYITELRNELDSAVQIAVLRGCDILYLAQINTDPSFELPSRVGVRVPAQATALGKSLLVDLSEKEIYELFKNVDFKKYNEATLKNVDELVDEISRVKAQGFSESNGELVERFYCVAAPVRDASGKVVAALSSTIPKRYLTSKPITKEKMIDSATKEAGLLSRELGYRL